MQQTTTYFAFHAGKPVRDAIQAELKRLANDSPGTPATISAAIRNLILRGERNEQRTK